MAAFRDSGCSSDDLSRLNLCRKFIHATTLSDITSGDGKRILQQQFDGLRLPHHHQMYEWPNQGKPSNLDWALWQATLRKCFLNASSVTLRDTKKLGVWTTPPHKTWRWFYIPQADMLLFREQASWAIYKKSRTFTRSHKFYKFASNTPFRAIDDSFIEKATCVIITDSIKHPLVVSFLGSSPYPRNTKKVFHSLREVFESLPPSAKSVSYTHLTLPTNREV